MPRLPNPGSDNNQWGDILNDFLGVEHNSDGTLKSTGSLAAKESTANKGAATGYPSLDSSAKVPIAQLPTGTTASTVVIGNDSRVTGALQSANDLSDVSNVSTARNNLGLGNAAIRNIGTTAGTAAAGDDSRITGAIQTSLFDTKGDLLVGTADDTAARLAVGTAGHVPMADPAASTGISWQPHGDQFTAGAMTMERRFASSSAVSIVSGAMRFSFFTAPRAETIANVAVLTGNTAAGATPTLCRVGIYSVAANGDLTLIGSCSNDTSLFAAANTRYVRALSASYSAALGQRYALAVLVVTAAATPTFVGIATNSVLAASFATSPRVTAALNSQSDLPASVAAGSLGTTNLGVYGEVLP